MYFKSKKISLLILGVTAILFSRILFLFFNDPEGPNLLVVMGMAAIVYFLSLAVYVYYPSTVLSTGLKRLLVVIFAQILLILIVGGIFFFFNHASAPTIIHTPASDEASVGYTDATYLIDGTPVTLVAGRAESAAAPGSASKIVTQYFGNEATGDLNGDGQLDSAFILTQQSGGSGTFYYVAAALYTATGYSGTNAILLGDRIAPQTTEIQNGEIVVNYADRRPGEPMTTAPSVGTSKYLTVTGTTLTEKK